MILVTGAAGNIGSALLNESLLPGGESRALKTGVQEARHPCDFRNSVDYDRLPVDPHRPAFPGPDPVRRRALSRERARSTR
ncbi:hypothetical protein EV562_103430 [Streptomyces sp. BK208]|uniref:hypothetical protein n=1 Tax=Streptomyces sp. BK208 TaxID=2512150 RepID=UPI001060C5B0|nr:hypothetical protein [Streptomyces sp. BK208]TDT40058.1 hypothetical protein EV562_103430 [Streptomyces sp. BK208]